MILSLVNVKGGVGKTTTAVNLAAVFAETGLRVLVVDLDPQASASFSLGLPTDYDGKSVYDILLKGLDAREAVFDTGLEGVHLVPGDLQLAGADLALARRPQPTHLLVRSLPKVRRRYEVIVIDSPPGLGVLTQNALQACQAYIVPTMPHDLALDALERFFRGIEIAREDLGRATQLLGVCLTMVDHRTGLTNEIVEQVRAKYGRRVFQTEIPVNVALAEAPRHGYTILEHQSWSPGGAAYRRLGGEVIRRMRRRGLL